MRLGVVMMGVGAHAAANAGVLRVLEERGIEPHCVCAINGGAWIAALWAMGRQPAQIKDAVSAAQQMGTRLFAPTIGAKAMLNKGANALCDGRRIEQMLLSQTGHRVLSLCERPVIFPCILARSGYRVVFSTRTIETEPGTMPAMQASVSFAARAVMALPPLIAPLEYMGSALLGEQDAAFACRMLLQLGAQRVMIVCPQVSQKRKPDAFDLMAATLMGDIQGAAREAHAGLMCVPLPEEAGAADMRYAMLCEQAGYTAAREQIDILFAQLGMARCRVLPFERRVRAT